MTAKRSKFFSKMNINEILAREGGRQVHLYKRGVFWTAYEQSALLLLREKSLQVRSGYVKSAGREIISVGFPEKTRLWFESRLGLFIRETENEGHWVINEDTAHPDFELLRRQVTTTRPVVTKSVIPGSANVELVIDKLIKWRLSDKTPLEAMLFIREIQDMLSDYGNSSS